MTAPTATERRSAAIRFNNLSHEMVSTDRLTAYRLLSSATTVDPTMAQGWFGLGNALADLKYLPASIAAFKRMLELPIGNTPGDATPEHLIMGRVNLGHRLLNDGRVDEAESVTREAVAIFEANPDLNPKNKAFAWLNLSQIISIKGDNDEAVRLARFAYEMDPNPTNGTGLAFCLLFAGEYAEGLKRFEDRFEYRLPVYLNFPYPRWDGTRVGKLYVAPDQGIGDTMSYTRFLPEVASLVGKVLYHVQSDILRLMQTALTPWPNIEVAPYEPKFPLADAWCPVVSLPLALGLGTPQIRNCPQRWKMPTVTTNAPEGWKAPDRKLHIAIAYAGAPGNDINRWRSIPVTDFLALYDVPGIQLYSVQIGDRVNDLHEAGCASLIRDMSPWIRDALDTVAIIQQCDLVITCESFVGHLAGAMGKETWIPLSYVGGDYRCGRHGDRPIWYPKTRLFRQAPDEGWAPVFNRIVEALRDYPLR